MPAEEKCLSHLFGILFEFVGQGQVLVRFDVTADVFFHRFVVIVADLLEVQMFDLFVDELVLEVLQFRLQKCQLILVGSGKFRLDEFMEETEFA